MIRDALDADVEAICAIYNHYIEHTFVTFEEVCLDAVAMGARIQSVRDKGLPWLVLEEEGEVLGYAYASPWHVRSAYRHSVESSVYLSYQAGGKGRGTALYEALIARLRGRDIHCVIGGVALPNPASVALHEKLRFEKAAHYKEVGWKQGRWIDVAYWQLML